MKSVLEQIDRYYNSFIDEQELYHFFLGLVDYVEYVYSIPEAKLVIAKLVEQRSQEYIKLESLGINSSKDEVVAIHPLLTERELQIRHLQKNTELWNAWYQLVIAELTLHPNGQMSKDVKRSEVISEQVRDTKGTRSVFKHEWEQIIDVNNNDNSYSSINPKDLLWINIDSYRNSASRFHNYLVKIVRENLSKSVSQDSRVIISISKREGIFRVTSDGLKLPYPIKGKRGEMVWKLGNKPQVPSSILGNNMAVVSKAVKKINELFQYKLNLDSKLILHLDTNGYSLNSDEYNVQFID